MNIEMLLNRMMWLTENIFGTVVFLGISILFSCYARTLNDGSNPDDLLAATAPMFHSVASTISTILWSVTGIIFLMYVIRKFFSKV